jgi:hypothetical protein
MAISLLCNNNFQHNILLVTCGFTRVDWATEVLSLLHVLARKQHDR